MPKYSIHIIDENGKGCYLSVKGKTEWKTKKTAIKHARDIMGTKSPVFGAITANIENEYGEIIRVIFRTKGDK